MKVLRAAFLPRPKHRRDLPPSIGEFALMTVIYHVYAEFQSIDLTFVIWFESVVMLSCNMSSCIAHHQGHGGKHLGGTLHHFKQN